MSFFDKSLQTLELPAVLEMLARHAVGETAKENARKLQPAVDAAEVRRIVQETTDARAMMVVRGSPSFSGTKDIRPSTARADLGGSLNTTELLQIASVLRCARAVNGYIADDTVGKTSIDYLFHALHPNKFLEERIFTSIIGEDEIADSASSDLTSIRRQMRAAAARARDALQKIISSPGYAKALQEPIITMRSDRYVVPVKADHKGAVPGLVHDISATGMTLFIEPMAAVKANNELRELAAKEKLEIERILAELSAECASHRTDIDADYEVLVKLDLIFAKAKLAYALECQPAEYSERAVVLRRARHPLLDQAKAVPINVELGAVFDTLVITGPNTGGKTVSLKTIGLLAAMNQCGLHIPAADGSCLPVFSHILSDIGDEQSIEQSLSTFSAHMTNIVKILEECDEHSLVLFDELGAGTDPTEGAALAISIIEYARQKGAVIAATTHYAELKVYATNEPGVQNASCEFDVETLRPTYRLLVGIPGKSNAFAISRRLGLGEDIIADAAKRVNTESATFEATIEKLEQTRSQLEKERDETARKLRLAEEHEKRSEAIRKELEAKLEKSNQHARRQAEGIIADARRVADETFRELDEMRRHANDEADAQQINAARSEMRRRLNLAEEDIRPGTKSEEITESSSRAVKAGDTVKIKSMGMKAVVISANNGQLVLRAGIMTVNAKEDEVLLLDDPGIQSKKKATAGMGTALRTATCPMEVDLRGMEASEALTVAEQYLDNAVMAKLQTVTIIHGKGTGVLRNTVQQMLRKNKHVKSFRLGRFGEGETGVTVVELK